MKMEGDFGESNYESNRVCKCIMMQEGRTSKIRDFKKGLQTIQNIEGKRRKKKKEKIVSFLQRNKAKLS